MNKEFLLLESGNLYGLRSFRVGIFLGIYVVTMLGSIFILTVICFELNLQTPTYFFWSNLCFLEIWYTTSIAPKMLQTLSQILGQFLLQVVWSSFTSPVHCSSQVLCSASHVFWPPPCYLQLPPAPIPHEPPHTHPICQWVLSGWVPNPCGHCCHDFPAAIPCSLWDWPLLQWPGSCTEPGLFYLEMVEKATFSLASFVLVPGTRLSTWRFRPLLFPPSRELASRAGILPQALKHKPLGLPG